MTFRVIFKEDALKEWNKLDSSLREQFKSKLDERRRHPKLPSARLRNMKNCYKIKLTDAGYRLVYEVRDKEIVIVVIAVVLESVDIHAAHSFIPVTVELCKST